MMVEQQPTHIPQRDNLGNIKSFSQTETAEETQEPAVQESKKSITQLQQKVQEEKDEMESNQKKLESIMA